MNGDRALVVVADQSRRPDHDPHFGKTAHGNHLAVIAAHIDAVDVINAGAVARLRLDLHLPGPPEQIHVVDVIAAKRGLQSLEYSIEGNAEDLHLVAINIEIDRGAGRRESAENTRQPRVLVGGDGETTQNLCKLCRIAATEIFQHVAETAAGPETDDRRRRERDHRCRFDLAKLRRQPRNHRSSPISMLPCALRMASESPPGRPHSPASSYR